MARRAAILIVVMLAFQGCASGRSERKQAGGVHARYLERIDQRQFHEAYLLIDEVIEQLSGVDEGAALEYQRLVTGAAGVGRHDWADIFSDPNVPFQYKHDLIAEINANMRKPQ